MDRLTGMWKDLQTSDRLPQPIKKSLMLTSCETELQELMKQIDIMVHNKYMDWERDMNIIQAKLDLREKEAMMQKSTLEQKHREVGQLRQQLEGMTKAQRDIVTQYEDQVTQLRNEMTTLKKDYEKLNKRHNKHTRDIERERERKDNEVQDSMVEVNRLNSQIEEYKQKTRDWDIQRQTYRNQIDGLESQRKTLSEKCSLAQQQSIVYHSELDRRRDMLDNTEVSLKGQVTHLEGQLNRARDTINHQEDKIEALKMSVEESCTGYKRMIDDNGALQDDVQQHRLTIRTLKDQIEDLSVQLKSRDELLRLANDDQKRNFEDIQKMEISLKLKDEALRSMNEIEHMKTNTQFEQLQEEIQLLKSQNKVFRKNEKKLNDEIINLQGQLESTKHVSADLNEELRKKKEEKRMLEQSDMKLMEEEIKQLRDKMGIMDEIHGGELDGMRKELSAMTSDLHQRNITIATLSEKTGHMEHQLRQDSNHQQKHSSQLQVANAQLEALRLENKHLRKTLLKHGDKDIDIEETENHLRDIQNAYTMSLARLEEENKRLRFDIDNLRHEIEEMQHFNQQKNQSLVKETEKALVEVRHAEERNMQHTKSDYERKLQSFQERLDATIDKYKSEIRALQSENNILKKEVDTKKTFIRRLTGELDVMGEFVDGVNQVVTSPTRRSRSGLDSSDAPRGESVKPRNSSLPLYSLERDHNSSGEDDGRCSSRASISTQFFAEELERKKQLERILDSRIQDLQDQTEETIKKYT